MTLLQIKELEARLERRDARIAELEAELAAIGAGGVSGPLLGCASLPLPGAQEAVATLALRMLVAADHITQEKADEAMSLAGRFAAPVPAVPAGQPLIARARDEWHEDDGPAMWWAWNGKSGWAGEPAWCGTPLSSDWRGYHTHWTKHPPLPPSPPMDGESNE